MSISCSFHFEFYFLISYFSEHTLWRLPTSSLALLWQSVLPVLMCVCFYDMGVSIPVCVYVSMCILCVCVCVYTVLLWPLFEWLRTQLTKHLCSSHQDHQAPLHLKCKQTTASVFVCPTFWGIVAFVHLRCILFIFCCLILKINSMEFKKIPFNSLKKASKKESKKRKMQPVCFFFFFFFCRCWLWHDSVKRSAALNGEEK